MPRPNILLIMSDQEQHRDFLPAALHRPGFESLVATGTAFDRHHVVVLPCGPSRSTIYTGLHTESTNVHLNPNPAYLGLDASVPTIGTMLRDHGYFTGYKGKWHVSEIGAPVPFASNTVHALEAYGFSDFNPDGDPVGVGWDGFRHDPAIASSAAAWIRGHGTTRPADQPWFLAVNFINPHDIMFFDATGEMNQTGNNAAPRLVAPEDPIYRQTWETPLPQSFAEDWATKPAAQSAFRTHVDSFLGEIPRSNEAAWHRFRDYYYNCLVDLDRNVEVVLNALRDSGEDRNTVVIYTADHGEAAGAHGMREKPISAYREVLNVPLLISHPDVPGGTSTSALSSAIDIVPTVLALAGVSTDDSTERYPQLRGVDLSSLLGSPTQSTERDSRGVVLSMRRPSRPGARAPEVEARQCLRGLVTDRWKLTRYSTNSNFDLPASNSFLGPETEVELYDTVADPHELHNLAHDPAHAGTVATLAAQLQLATAAEVAP